MNINLKGEEKSGRGNSILSASRTTISFASLCNLELFPHITVILKHFETQPTLEEVFSTPAVFRCKHHLGLLLLQALTWLQGVLMK